MRTPNQSPTRSASRGQALSTQHSALSTQLAYALLAVGAATTIACGLASPEGIHHFDDLTHYLMAKWAWRWPAYLLNDWARPGFNVLYFLPAGLGWPACRVLSAVLAAVSAWLAFRSAQSLGLRHSWAVVPLCYVQPLFFQLAQTTLTETTLGFYLMAAVYLAIRGNWGWSAAFISLGTVARHEAVIFVPLWIILAWRERIALWRLWPVVLAPAATNIGAVLAGMSPAIVQMLSPKPSEQYGRGGWLTFFVRAMQAWGPGVLVLVMVGLRPLAKSRGGRIIAATAAAYFCTHAAIRALGLFNSGGYARFIVPICPLVAIAALAGWLKLRSTDQRERRTAVMAAAGFMILLWIAMERQLALYAARLDEVAELPEVYAAKVAIRVTTVLVVVAAIASAGFGSWRRSPSLGTALMPAVLVAITALTCFKLCRPLARPAEAYIIDDLKRWLAASGFADREIITSHVWVSYAMGQALPPTRPSVREQLDRAPPGTLFVWDEQFAAAVEPGLEFQALASNPEFRLIHSTPPAQHRRKPYLVVFEKAEGRPLGG